MATKPHLAAYWSGIQKSLDQRLSGLRNYLRHPASGIPIEGYFRDLLREYLPRRYAVEPGFVVNAEGDQSDFLDVIIADLQDIPPLCSESLLKVYSAESVVAAIEITSAPKPKVRRSGIDGKIPKLEDDILKLAKLRRIARKRKYLDHSPQWFINDNNLALITFSRELMLKLSPRAFLIVCGDEWKKARTFEAHLDSALRSASARGGEAWLNGVLSVQHGLITFKPNSVFERKRFSENGLLEFILFLNKAVSDFLTLRIDVRRYRPTLPEQQEETATDVEHRMGKETGFLPAAPDPGKPDSAGTAKDLDLGTPRKS